METLVAVAVVALVVLRRLRGRRVAGPRQPIVIAVLALYGGTALALAVSLARPGHLTGGDVALLSVSAAFSLAMGAVRGTTVLLYRREGEVYARYGAVAVVLWLATFAVRLLLDAGAAHFGAQALVARAGLVLMFALSLIGEAVVVRIRAARPFPVPGPAVAS